MEWKLIKDEKPPISTKLIVSDGNIEMEAYMNLHSEFKRENYFLEDVGFYPKAWRLMPKWEGEK